MDINEARLHKATLNLHTHASTFSRLSIPSEDGKQNLSEVVLYKTIILPVLYGCETWSLTFREECRLSTFENRILRRIFGPKRDDNGEWRRFHNEELNSLYRSPNIVRVIKSRRLRWAGHVARTE